MLYQNKLKVVTSGSKNFFHYQIWLSFVITLFKSLDINLLKTFNYLNKNFKLKKIKDKLALKATVNKSFLYKNQFFFQTLSKTLFLALKETSISILIILTEIILTLIIKILCNTFIAIFISTSTIIVILKKN